MEHRLNSDIQEFGIHTKYWLLKNSQNNSYKEKVA